MNHGFPREKLAFVISLAVLAWLHGFATSARRWFPNDLVVRAWDQARSVVPGFGRPLFLRPRVHDWHGAKTLDPEFARPGLTLISTMGDHSGWMPEFRLVGQNGRTVHRWLVDPSELSGGSAPRHPAKRYLVQVYPHGSELLPNGDLVANLDYLGTVRLDPCGRVRWWLPVGSHHSIARAEDGSFWIPAVTNPPAGGDADSGGSFPGIGRPEYQDLILQVSEDGEVLRELNVLELLYDNDLERHIPKWNPGDTGDVTHLNDVEPLAASMASEYPTFEAGDLLISLRNLDLVLVFDPGNGRVKWHASHPFIHQHDPDFLGGGWIGVLDNNVDGTDRGSMLGGSRIVALQPHTDSTKVLFPADRAETFYTSYAGTWQDLGQGNLLLAETETGRVVEVAPGGRTVWEWVREPHDESTVAEVYEATRYGFTTADVASWPCSRVE